MARVALGVVDAAAPGRPPADRREALALALLSALAGALAVVCLGVFFAALDRMSVAPGRRAVVVGHGPDRRGAAVLDLRPASHERPAGAGVRAPSPWR